MSSKDSRPQKKAKTETGAVPTVTEPENEEEIEIDQEIMDKLDAIQSKISDIDEEAAQEIVAINKKYNDKKFPHMKERNAVLKQISGFWQKTFAQHPVLGQCLSEQDVMLLGFLEDLEVQDEENFFQITLKFKANPHLKTNTLWKKFTFSLDGSDPGSIECSPIQFKPGKEVEGFLSTFFTNVELPKGEEIEGNPFGEDFQVGEVIKDEIWQNPVAYYLGEAVGEEEIQIHNENEDEEDEE
eukprot:TRINITY_DN4258_c0_g1_i1.p1 TRINITY_DN4258_c0_g1~~TRINITY_DN4258_c0_g1_i1.p1  ORF type:complete len:269 (-),score=68.10 TRINITY_DN4258_c0_g1_i1:59-781(-)